MKKTLLLFLFYLMIFSVFSQNYDPVLKEGAFSDIQKSTVPCGVEKYIRVEIGADTLINNLTYKKIRFHNFSGHYEDPCMVWDMPLQVLPNVSYINNDVEVYHPVFVREDISEKKVYIWATDQNDVYKEFTLYDFNLEANDVITNSYYYRGGDVTISSTEIDENGKKRYYIQNTPSYYTEGLGSETGLLFLPRIIGPEDPYLFCYGNAQNQNNCATVLSTDKFALSIVKMYPNPVKDKLFITLKEPATVTLYSMLGKKLKTYLSNTSLEIDMKPYQKGVYLLQVTNQQKAQKSLKLIKQ